MEKPKKWHLGLIIAVISLTIYNILPTVFYYSNNLQDPINAHEGSSIAKDIQQRINALETDAVDWLHSYCKLLNIKPISLTLDQEHPQLIPIECAKTEEASKLRKFLWRSGTLIASKPSQLFPLPDDPHSSTVSVLRTIPLHIEETDNVFSFCPKFDKEGTLTTTYSDWVLDRAATIGSVTGGPSESALIAQTISAASSPDSLEAPLLALAEQLNELNTLFKNHSALLTRFSTHFFKGTSLDQAEVISRLNMQFDALRDGLKKQKSSLKPEDANLQLTTIIEKKEATVALAQAFLKKNKTSFLTKTVPLKLRDVLNALKANPASLDLSSDHPLFDSLIIDWERSTLSLTLHPDLLIARKEWPKEQKELLERLIINEAARIARQSDEQLLPEEGAFSVGLHPLKDASSFIFLDLQPLAKKQIASLIHLLKTQWHPHHPDLLLERFPIVDANEFEQLSELQKKLCLCITSLLTSSEKQSNNLKTGSLYILVKGLDKISSHAEQSQDDDTSRLLQEDLSSLATLLQRAGFFGYPAASLLLPPDAREDYVFELPNALSSLLLATREQFYSKGSKRFAVLEMTTKEQRLLAKNRIETALHEELLNWKDEYLSSQINPDPQRHFDIPKPKRSIFLSNLALTWSKYLRGDERKIIRWGLDLSGGKTVQIELRDANNHPVSDESALKQGMNELFKRVNKMGVSDVTLRQVGKDIVLDFPSSQGISAAELIKASTMYFHVVNEQFSNPHGQYFQAATRFLQDVWNEASLLDRKDAESVNAIAYRHLYGDTSNPEPRSDAARFLFEQGLKLQNPQDRSRSNSLDTTYSKIALFRGKEVSEWHQQTHPLLIVFSNYVLEGSHLSNIRSSYDPTQGNFLSFDVKSTVQRQGSSEPIRPRDQLSAWTSQFSKERIQGTALESFSLGQGWRMAVVLNDTIINAPTLNSPLKDSAMISGNFTQREVSQLAADLKAGSLTFTPHILSEKNVSPELGTQDRLKGIGATILALIIVVVSMLVYYRFSGLVASVAVLFNLLIMWAVLQNLQATLSLAGIAGIILTVGMSIDANVLVFERIKEEFALHGRIAAAIQSGYQKAFSAIVDSNITTIIAALVLLNFDAGPIKGFAITLIIGIASSMFTALFMTKTYFSHWVQTKTHRALSMANWIKTTSFDFLKRGKWAFALAATIIILGSAVSYNNRATLFGMDFTGGCSTTLNLPPMQTPSLTVAQALIKNGANSNDFQLRELGSPTRLRVLFSTSMEQKGKPFYQENPNEQSLSEPKVQWLVAALAKERISLNQDSLEELHANWTSMSGQMSDSMRNNALIGLGIAFACIFIYLAIRFEATYATSATICLLHDVLITLGIMGILNALKVPIQIDLNTIAALMTIVGYSLNDTIIIFDRIREEMHSHQSRSLKEIINQALNATLSRTTITSGTTLFVLLALVGAGGASMFSFALVMTIGVFFGTLSSWFIAAPCLAYLMQKTTKKEQQSMQLNH